MNDNPDELRKKGSEFRTAKEVETSEKCSSEEDMYREGNQTSV